MSTNKKYSITLIPFDNKFLAVLVILFYADLTISQGSDGYRTQV